MVFTQMIHMKAGSMMLGPKMPMRPSENSFRHSWAWQTNQKVKLMKDWTNFSMKWSQVYSRNWNNKLETTSGSSVIKLAHVISSGVTFMPITSLVSIVQILKDGMSALLNIPSSKLMEKDLSTFQV